MPRTGASEARDTKRLKDAPDWSIRGGVEHGQNPRTGSSGGEPGARTGASEARDTKRLKDAPDWSIRGGMKHGTSPRTGSSGGEPGATDWSILGNGENT